MAFPAQYFYSILDVAGRWGCTQTEVVNYAMSDEINLVAGFSAVKFGTECAAGLMHVPGSEVRALFRPYGKGAKRIFVIRPYADGGVHEARNGLLLRRDIHSLFDAGYVTVTPDLRFEVSGRIREEFDNGIHYYALHGQSIELPEALNQRPDPAALSWHNEHRFNG